jgi:hypothetical protein
MKNKLSILILIFISGLTSILAQNNPEGSCKLAEYNNDTVKYTKEKIVGAKNKFIGKPLSTLLKELPLPVKSYMNAFSDRYENIYFSTYLLFYSYREREEMVKERKNPLEITITCSIPLTKKELDFLGRFFMGGQWTQAVNEFYKNRIIKDVNMVQYD